MTYGKGDWAMYVFMPHQAGSLDKLTSWLTLNWENIRKEFVSDKAILIRFPQFRIENNFKLVPFLRELGINRVLSPGANFSRMMKQGGG
jgi:serine protease inhibitor